jgi:pyruvate/2-oxoglutarate dehydrogenase complex dihydrolipoamide dehydrogenase (E3) component
VIEHGPQLLAREDPDVAEEIRRILNAEGIDVLVGTDVLQVEGRSGAGVRLRVRAAGGERMAVVQTAMLGRLAYTVLRDAMLAHPTMAEGLNSLFVAVPVR